MEDDGEKAPLLPRSRSTVSISSVNGRCHETPHRVHRAHGAASRRARRVTGRFALSSVLPFTYSTFPAYFPAYWEKDDFSGLDMPRITYRSKQCTGRYQDTREDQVDQEWTGGTQSTKPYKRWGSPMTTCSAHLLRQPDHSTSLCSQNCWSCSVNWWSDAFHL